MNESERQTAEGILLTDEYQLTMAQLYYRMGMHEKPAQFDHFFRNYPDYGTHKAGYCVNAGLEWLLNWMDTAHFRDEDVEFLRSQTGRTGRPVFAGDFLAWLRQNGNFDGLTVWAIPEGRVVHPNVPLTVVQGPLAMAQILETALLNKLNYQTLIATKAARIRESGRGQLLMEFGLRRAQDRGGNAGTRAALIGGADFSSNVGISHVLGYPPKGTHAHSMVQAFIALGEGELEAFRAYAGVYPDDCLLLVDTINTLESGVPNAIKVFQELRQKGHEPVGIRLDSGDLAYLSIQAARMLDAAGFPDTSIVLSSNLDELVIWQIITQIADEAPRYGMDADHVIRRLVYGVGTRLITSRGNSALGGVYKLVALHDEGQWIPALKISETAAKTPNPGQKRVWRLYDRREKATADLITLEDEAPGQMERMILRHPTEHTKFRVLRQGDLTAVEPLLVEVVRDGRPVYQLPSIEEIRQRRVADVERLDPGVRRLLTPHIYHVSLSQQLWDLKQQLIESFQAA
ncbi:MAG: nicotinate phosphoribosyltransferase [Chloroflexi bacterium]|nr:nicotinate phosphoribosyltransferase [Chloroflexota bacterium]MCI0577251.1 nicotinate phosphoribosyltransferase [Chloroflexota bacterium]MCI0646732.1 nicotinate phosphoribosyltransferase [Chloroflexota bacterium]MCI0731366.1 nicotinate phosphoribosyltransferase [Chloroflexota bacterium]